VCDLETSRIGAPYTYDISHLRVNYDNDLLQALVSRPKEKVFDVELIRSWEGLQRVSRE
jgi:hypothetical protein